MSTSPTVLIIGPTPPPFHGVAVAMDTLLRSPLSERFHLVHLDLADRRGIQHVNKPDLHDVFLFSRQWIRLLNILFQKRPTLTYLVLSQSTIGFLRDSFLIWPAVFSGSRIVLHLHGGYFKQWVKERTWFMKTYVRMVLRRITRAIVLGETLKEQFEGLVSETKIAVVSNGIDWNGVDSSPKAGRVDSRFRILHLSTLSHLKGALVLIEAIPIILQHRQDVELVCAGPWSHLEDKQWAEDFIAKQGIADHVRFAGQVEGDAKRGLFDSSDLFVFPGVQQEGQPLVVIEAMAAGLPVIFTNRGCLRDTVIEGETGFETPINDPAALAERILWILDHPDALRAMGQRGRHRYESFYTKERHIKNMIEVFTSACIDGTR